MIEEWLITDKLIPGLPSLPRLHWLAYSIHRPGQPVKLQSSAISSPSHDWLLYVVQRLGAISSEMLVMTTLPISIHCPSIAQPFTHWVSWILPLMLWIHPIYLFLISVVVYTYPLQLPCYLRYKTWDLSLLIQNSEAWDQAWSTPEINLHSSNLVTSLKFQLLEKLRQKSDKIKTSVNNCLKEKKLNKITTATTKQPRSKARDRTHGKVHIWGPTFNHQSPKETRNYNIAKQNIFLCF